MEKINGYETSIHHSGYCMCGYVAIPKGHPWHGLDYDALSHVDVHGGLTYSKKANGHAGLDGDSWVIGFDCGHAGDATYLFPKDEHRSDEYVRGQIEYITLQAIEHAN